MGPKKSTGLLLVTVERLVWTYPHYIQVVAARQTLTAVEDALFAVGRDTLVAVGGGTLAVEEGCTMDPVEDDTLAVEGVANL